MAERGREDVTGQLNKLTTLAALGRVGETR